MPWSTPNNIAIRSTIAVGFINLNPTVFDIGGRVMINKSVGKKIRDLRKLKGISQEDLGEAIGVSRQAVCKWEADEITPNL